MYWRRLLAHGWSHDLQLKGKRTEMNVTIHRGARPQGTDLPFHLMGETAER